MRLARGLVSKKSNCIDVMIKWSRFRDGKYLIHDSSSTWDDRYLDHLTSDYLGDFAVMAIQSRLLLRNSKCPNSLKQSK